MVIKIHIAMVTYFDSRKLSAFEQSEVFGQTDPAKQVDPDQTAPSSMIRVFCLHLLGPLPYGRTTLLKVYDYTAVFGMSKIFYDLYGILLQEPPKIFAFDVL